MQLPKNGFELAADHLAGLGGMAAPDAAGHHHLFALRGHAQALEPLVVLVLEHIAADQHFPKAAGALLEQQLEGLFSRFGAVQQVRVAKNSRNSLEGGVRGFAHVVFEEEARAMTADEKLG